MKSLWHVKVSKDRGFTDTCKFNVVADNAIEAIHKAKREARKLSGWAARCYECVELQRDETRII